MGSAMMVMIEHGQVCRVAMKDISLACLLVFLQRVYILGPRTNLQLENSHGESQEEGQEKGRKEEVTRR
jgi:hypothetical protein